MSTSPPPLRRRRPTAILDEVEEFLTGVRPVHVPDRALATVLFTDIVSSTERAAALGDDDWTRILDHHDARIGREVEGHRGRRINTTGDGILATFDGPARAIRSAQAICAQVRSLGIEVRAGLHTGEIERRGDDIGGIAVHIGQRVSALAGPGEVLVSSTVKDLAAGLASRSPTADLMRSKACPTSGEYSPSRTKGELAPVKHAPVTSCIAAQRIYS